jgi:hypothetical protein
MNKLKSSNKCELVYLLGNNFTKRFFQSKSVPYKVSNSLYKFDKKTFCDHLNFPTGNGSIKRPQNIEDLLPGEYRSSGYPIQSSNSYQSNKRMRCSFLRDGMLLSLQLRKVLFNKIGKGHREYVYDEPFKISKLCLPRIKGVYRKFRQKLPRSKIYFTKTRRNIQDVTVIT